ncbi:hypothetical protein PG994_007584 [Apiospora phragmitis]|uniref:C2H2-type domain-containing protein n=1 Tax=Apiospora phragmitis TaxID=2905665 RepID=A0ABR1V190_9PEZI
MSSELHRYSRLKRPRLPGSEGCHSPSPSPSENPAERFRQLLSDHVKEYSPAAEDSDNLACPFVKHNPGRYAYVVNSCTETGFKDVGSLRDHIKRVHSRKYGCTECHSHRFNCGKKQLGAAKAKHQSQKECKESKQKRQDRGDASEPEWMTEEQEREYDKLDLRRSRLDNLEESFREIYTHLWPGSKADVSTIPAHSYGSGFLVSMFVIDQVFEKLSMGPTRRLSSGRLPSQQQPSYEQEDATEAEDDPSPQPPADDLAGMLGVDPFDYPTYVTDPTAAPPFIANNGNSYSHSMYSNPGTYLPSESYSQPAGPSQFNSSNDQFVMRPFYDGSAIQADEPRVPPFPYTIPVSTNPSNQDSAYGTNPSSDENDCYKTQQLQQHHHYSNAAPQVTDWAALQHAGPTGPEQNPPAGDDIHLDEEGAGEEFTYFNSYLRT